MKILLLCTKGNSCRSLMAEAFLQALDPLLEVFSAGLYPDKNADPLAIKVMNEVGIDISMKNPKSFDVFSGMEFDYFISLCDGTKEKIESVKITAKRHIHLGFEDPRKDNCTETQLISRYRNVRDEIRNELDYFYNRVLINELKRNKTHPD